MRTQLKVSLSQAATLIRNVGTTNTFILRGQPGVGKSAILKMLASEMPDYLPCYIDCANLDLGDLGMPVIDRETMVTNYMLFTDKSLLSQLNPKLLS